MATLVPPKRGLTKRIDRMYDYGFFGATPHHATNSELRIKDMETDGVDAEVIYGILGVSAFIGDPDLLRLIYSIYNTWVAEFCGNNPDRLVGLACLPNDDPELAADELRRVAKLGLRGADFAVTTALKPLWHSDWDPLWAASEECTMPLSFHATGYPLRNPSDPEMAKEYYLPHRLTFLTIFQIAGSEFLASIIFSGATERHPGFKFVLGECGAAWVPYVLGRMDDEYEDYAEHGNFSIKPSEYWE